MQNKAMVPDQGLNTCNKENGYMLVVSSIPKHWSCAEKRQGNFLNSQLNGKIEFCLCMCALDHG